jgi:hypothetical protein
LIEEVIAKAKRGFEVAGNIKIVINVGLAESTFTGGKKYPA